MFMLIFRLADTNACRRGVLCKALLASFTLLLEPLFS